MVVESSNRTDVCELFSNLSSELSSLGACVDGDFNGSSIECSLALNSTEPNLYNYETCPDVNECDLNIHDCHLNAQCTNTHGSF